MGFISLLKERFAPKETVKTVEEQQQDMADVRCRAMEILDRIEPVFPLLEQFPEEKALVYQVYLNKFSSGLSEMKACDEDTAEVDEFLKSTVTRLIKAVHNVDAESMGYILKGLDRGLELRSAVVNDGEKLDEEKVQDELEEMSLLMRDCMLIFRKESEIQKENRNLTQYTEENKEIREKLESFGKEYPDVVKAVSEGKAAGDLAHSYIVLLDNFASSNVLVEGTQGKILNLQKDVRSLRDAMFVIGTNRNIGDEREIREELEIRMDQIVQEMKEMEASRIEWRKQTREMLERLTNVLAHIDAAELKHIRIAAAKLAAEKEQEKKNLEERIALRQAQEVQEQEEQARLELEKPAVEPVNLAEELMEEV